MTYHYPDEQHYGEDPRRVRPRLWQRALACILSVLLVSAAILVIMAAATPYDYPGSYELEFCSDHQCSP